MFMSRIQIPFGPDFIMILLSVVSASRAEISSLASDEIAPRYYPIHHTVCTIFIVATQLSSTVKVVGVETLKE